MVDGSLLLLAAAAFLAGAVNAVAGGGTLLTFPALVFLGADPVQANATSTVALWPGTLGAIWGYRREITERDALIGVLAIPSAVGGALGAWLLLATPASLFEGLVPFLILFAAVLFGLHGRVSAAVALRRGTEARTRGWWWAAVLMQAPVAVYGGYFGAGIGILMLAWLGVLGLEDINVMNGIKAVLGMLINAVAVLIFATSGIVDWPSALAMAVASVVGGVAGAGLARRLGQARLRAAIVVLSLVVAAVLFYRAYA